MLFKWWRHPAVVPALLLLPLVLGFLPPQLQILLLATAVALGAHEWDALGGFLSALAASAVLGVSLVRHDYLPRPDWQIGFGIVVLLLLALGTTAGFLRRYARAVNRLETDLAQAQQQLSALHKIALSLSTTLDVNRLLETILDQLGSLWGYDFSCILLLDDQSQELVLAAARGYPQELGYRVPLAEGISGAVVRGGKAICVGDVTRDPRYIDGVQGAMSEVAVPLVWEGRTIGVINVESRQSCAFGPADVSLLTTVAEQAAGAIGNARLHQQTRHLAITDPHTGLYNYRHFQDQVGLAIRDAQLAGGHCSLIMLDLDHFKRVNDTYGHPTGDNVLAQMAKLLRESCRSHDLVFRYGGEEFAIILPGTGGDVAIIVAERIRRKVAGYCFTGGAGRPLEFGLTVSLGVASYPRDGLSAVDILIAADTSLYRAKGEGRNRVASADAPVSSQQ